MTDRELFEHIDVEDFLKWLDIRNVRDMGAGEVMFSCPFPGHSHLDKNPSASMSKVERPSPKGGHFPKTSFNCFTCGMRGTAISFLAEYEGISPVDAKMNLRHRYARDVGAPKQSELMKIINDLLNVPETKRRRPAQTLDEEEVKNREVLWIEVFMEWTQTHNSPEPFNYMLDRGFEPETLIDYQIGYDSESSRFSIPIRDHEGNLVGFKGRAWWPDAKPKYMPLGGEGYSFDHYEMSRFLYLLNIAKKPCAAGYEMIVREGELNALMLHQHNRINTVGVSGNNLSNIQVDLIVNFCDCAIVYFDKLEDSIKNAKKLEGKIRTKIAWTEQDPCDDIEAALIAVDSAEESLTCGVRSICYPLGEAKTASIKQLKEE